MAFPLNKGISIRSKTSPSNNIRRRHWLAWIFLCAALALHVLDEAFTDFLGVYNPAVQAIQERQPLLMLPTFSFNVWLSLLIFAVIALVGVSVFVWKGRWAMRPISYVFAAVMLTNGLLHIVHSIYMLKLMPGVYTSPLLLAASIVLVASTHAHKQPST
jgi:membrane-associated PAP2 superfamily phosphatase